MRARRVVVALVLGAATTVGFAWAPGFFVDRWSLPYEVVGDPHFETLSASYRSGFAIETFSPHSEFRCGTFRSRNPTYVPPMRSESTVEISSRWWSRTKDDSLLRNTTTHGMLAGQGWPMICLYRVDWRLRNGAISRWPVLKGGILISKKKLPFGSMRRVILPYFPIWPALAINVGTHSLAWFVVLSGIVVLRGFIRTARGKCAKCAYDVTRLSQCPECGLQCAPRWRRAQSLRSA